MEETRRKQKHFVLIHGGGHGAWCWYRVVTLLKSQGHCVTALDMAASGINTKRVEEISSLFDYCQPLMDFMTSLDEDEKVILVGHSLGGICISIAMENFPQKIDHAVFVTAIMPSPDFTASEINKEVQKKHDSYMDCRFVYGDGDDKPPTYFYCGVDFMATKLYQLSPPEDLALATSLVRPDRSFDLDISLSKQKYGLVRRVFVVCEEDYMLTKEIQDWMIEKNLPHVVKRVSGADHMVMFSNSKELCEVLVQDLDKN